MFVFKIYLQKCILSLWKLRLVIGVSTKLILSTELYLASLVTEKCALMYVDVVKAYIALHRNNML